MGFEHVPVRGTFGVSCRRADIGDAHWRHRPFGFGRRNSLGLSNGHPPADGVAGAVLVGLAVGPVVGIVNGVGIAILRVQPLVMTLGTGLMTQGTWIVYSQKIIGSAPRIPEYIIALGSGTCSRRADRCIPLGPLAALMILGLRHTGFGRLLYAAGDNREACQLAGVEYGRCC